MYTCIVLQTSLVPGPTPKGKRGPRIHCPLGVGPGYEANFKQCHDTIIQYPGALH